MDVMPWQAVVFVSIPEAFLINLMGFTFVGVRPDLKKLGIFAVFQALCSYFIRALPFVYGVHIVLQTFTAIILIKVILRYRWQVVFPGVLLGFAVFLGVLDTLYLPLVMKRIPYETVLSNVWIRIGLSVPEQLMMLVIVLLCRKYDFKVIDVSTCEEGKADA